MALSLFVQIKLNSSTRDRFISVVTAHRDRVLTNEPGCQRFDVMIPEDTEDQVCLYEVYEDADAFKLHRETDYMKAYRQTTAEMVADRSLMLSNLME